MIGNDIPTLSAPPPETDPYLPRRDTYQIFDLPWPASLQQRSDGRYDDEQAISSGPQRDALWYQTGTPLTRLSHDRQDDGTSASEVRAGLDGLLFDGTTGTILASLTARYRSGDAKVVPPQGDNKFRPDAYRFGSSLTWFALDGFYLDAQAQLDWLSGESGSPETNAQTLSLEVGQKLRLGKGLSIRPQAQLTYLSSAIDGLAGFPGALYDINGWTLRGRTGLALTKESVWHDESGGMHTASLYGIGNLYYAFANTSAVSDRHIFDFSLRENSWGHEIGIGGSYDWRFRSNRYTVFAEVASVNGFHSNLILYGGLKIRW